MLMILTMRILQVHWILNLSDQEVNFCYVGAVLVRDVEEYISAGPISAGADFTADIEGALLFSIHQTFLHNLANQVQSVHHLPTRGVEICLCVRSSHRQTLRHRILSRRRSYHTQHRKLPLIFVDAIAVSSTQATFQSQGWGSIATMSFSAGRRSAYSTMSNSFYLCLP